MTNHIILNLFDSGDTAAADLQPVITALQDYYGTTDATALLSAMDAHHKSAQAQQQRTVAALRRLQAVRDGFGAHLAAERLLSDWQAQGEKLRQRRGDFAWETAVADPTFLSMLKAGVPVDKAWLSLQLQDLPLAAPTPVAARPAENGTSRTGGLLPGKDVSRLSRSERAELAKRSLKGETIRL